MTPPHTIEGTWEEIARRAEELKGHRLRVTVLNGDALPPVPPTHPDRWPVGFFENTYGSQAPAPQERLPQGEPDAREPLP